jgi:pimeloyl-ACP methyl ester carboxylesterase
MNAYFISGLAADGKMFRSISLPEGYTQKHLDWIPPLKKESLEHYAWRMGQMIDHSHPFVIIGLSLGGMLASEISRQYMPAKTILISSIPCSAHLPSYLRVLGMLKIHKIVPVSFFKFAAILKRKISITKSEDKRLITETIRLSEPSFIRWGMDAVLGWKAKKPPASYVHIHGSLDEILPILFTKPTHVIKGAGHLMVLTRAKELNKILREVLTVSK